MTTIETAVARKHHHWFPPASCAELTDRLVNAGPTARLEVHQDGQKTTLRVMARNAAGAMVATHALDINDSRPCPPICPDEQLAG